MLSGILNNDRAVEVNIQIMWAFVKLRQMIHDQAELKRELDELRSHTEEKFQVVFKVLDKLTLYLTHHSGSNKFFRLC